MEKGSWGQSQILNTREGKREGERERERGTKRKLRKEKYAARTQHIYTFSFSSFFPFFFFP